VSHNRPFTGVSLRERFGVCCRWQLFRTYLLFNRTRWSLGTWTWTSGDKRLPLEGDGSSTSVSCTSSSTCVACGTGTEADNQTLLSGTEAGSTVDLGRRKRRRINSSAIYGTFSSVSCVTSNAVRGSGESSL